MYIDFGAGIVATDEFNVSPPVSMNSENTVMFAVSVFQITVGTLTVTLQQSADGENWQDVATAEQTWTGIGYKKLKATDIASPFVRLKYETSSASSTSILAASINTSKQ